MVRKVKRVKNNYKETSFTILFNVPIMESVFALLLFATSVGVHGLALHVIYPVPHAEQSILLSSSHNVASLLPPLTVGVPFGHVQVLPEH